MAIKNIYLRGGTTAEHASFTGYAREVTVDTDKKTLVAHDGATSGGFPMALASDVPTILSQLTEDAGLWQKTELTKVSQLTNDAGYWTGLTKVSQLTNDSGYKTAHCTYCSYCTYCSLCSRCNSVQCSTVQCTQIKCSNCTQCSRCNCSSDCTDDGCFVSGKLETARGRVDVFELLVGDELIDENGNSHPIVGISHGQLKDRRVVRLSGMELTEDHPWYLLCLNKWFKSTKVPSDLTIVADNGVVGKYPDSFSYHEEDCIFLNMEAETPTVCPICETPIIVTNGFDRVLIPGQITD